MRVDILPFSFRLELSAKETTSWTATKRIFDYSNLATRWITVEVGPDGSARVEVGPGKPKQNTPAHDELTALLRDHVLLTLPEGHPCRAFVKEGRVAFTQRPRERE